MTRPSSQRRPQTLRSLHTPRRSTVLFALVVLFGLAQVTWWIVFQFREADRLETVSALLLENRSTDALDTLLDLPSGDSKSPDRVRDAVERQSWRRRFMFAAEGAFLGLIVLLGVAFFYASLVRERRMRLSQQRFLAGTTHELKTPLTTLRLGLDSIESGSLDAERQQRYRKAMRQELDRLDLTVDNLLSAASLTASGTRERRRVDPVPEDVDLQPGNLASDAGIALESMRPRAETLGIALEWTDSPDPRNELNYLRDPRAVQVILRNLLDNALKYSSRGDRVDVHLEREADIVRVVVADTGCGIRAEDLPYLFEPFYRGRTSFSSDDTDDPQADVATALRGVGHIGGSGIGLGLVRDLARSHGGTVYAASLGPGQGATFTVSFPNMEQPS